MHVKIAAALPMRRVDSNLGNEFLEIVDILE